MTHKGKVFKFGDNINTDFIISGRYKFAITDMKQLSRHLFEDIRPGFYDEIEPDNSIVVAGHNFGMGSSREQAPHVIKQARINCVVAKSFARIFYRNAFNIGLALIEADTDCMQEKDTLTVDFKKGLIRTLASGKDTPFLKWNNFQLALIKSGGIVNYLEKFGTFKV